MATATKAYAVAQTPGSQDSPALLVPKYVDNIAISAAVAKTITVPADSQGNKARFAIFSFTGDFWACWTGAASVPSADALGGTGSELNPRVRALDGETSFSLIASADCVGSIAWGW